MKSALLASFASANGGIVYEQYFDGDDADVKAVDFEKRVALVERFKTLETKLAKLVETAEQRSDTGWCGQ